MKLLFELEFSRGIGVVREKKQKIYVQKEIAMKN